MCQTDPTPSPGRICLGSVSKSPAPHSCLKSRVPALRSPWHSQSSGLAGSHVILICFHHGNSKLKQRAEQSEGRLLGSKAPRPVYFTSISSLRPGFHPPSLHSHRFHTRGKVRGALRTSASTALLSPLWQRPPCPAASRTLGETDGGNQQPCLDSLEISFVDLRHL